MKYQATITGLGACALDFLDECCNFIIIFNEDAPSELADISVLHTKCEVKEDPKKGDTVRICGVEYTISDVGWEALNTLKELGHCTLSFKGLDTVERPGIIELVGEPIKAEQLLIGGTIEIE
ncbi:PTS glucitol/sorbitol transporter subunit IIA [[Clostridium] innocuum]|nr:PTS glucitol/sorbitol transporter subunit IIA [Erysipelotrichaceae bacterium]MCR0382374.1 PTS glucitol/sorbitol transporter subunit IIA [[Clostridium] innocuum]MCR0532738.1 PTS glucitol/sorbitol transporter subunit IIA [[Clostridium] innocuum]MCR0536798.1 PTS glucitol/sorbitol transporter subunit IIA [[Clostridium] innocuum]MDU1120269.1 PTS glucitol/sorbitol transporter subunit IIA [Erysipelotrichaceae bacterium]